jgi:hypothetical protein
LEVSVEANANACQTATEKPENKATLILEGELSLEGKCKFWFRGPGNSGFLSGIVSRHFAPGGDPREAQFGRCRAVFVPLANQGSPLSLEGNIAISMGEFHFESPAVNDWLEVVFLQHFYPEDTPCEGEDLEEDCPFELGAYQITFETLS